MATAAGMATGATTAAPRDPGISTLPLRTLVLITHHLSARDARELCGTCWGLRRLRDSLLPHALSARLPTTRVQVPDGVDRGRLCGFALSRDGLRVAFRVPYDYYTTPGGGLTKGDVVVGPLGEVPTVVRGAGYHGTYLICFSQGPDDRPTLMNSGGCVEVVTPEGVAVPHRGPQDGGRLPYEVVASGTAKYLCVEDSITLHFVHRDRRARLDLPLTLNSGPIDCTAVSTDLSRAATVDECCIITAWDTHTKAVLLHTKILASTSDPHCVLFSDDNAFIIASFVDPMGADIHTGIVKVIDMASGECVSTLQHSMPDDVFTCGPLLAVRGTVVLVVFRPGKVVLMNARTGETSAFDYVPRKFAHSAALSPDCSRATVVYADGIIKAWNVGRLAARLRRRGQRRAATAE